MVWLHALLFVTDKEVRKQAALSAERRLLSLCGVAVGLLTHQLLLLVLFHNQGLWLNFVLLPKQQYHKVRYALSTPASCQETASGRAADVFVLTRWHVCRWWMPRSMCLSWTSWRASSALVSRSGCSVHPSIFPDCLCLQGCSLTGCVCVLRQLCC